MLKKIYNKLCKKIRFFTFNNIILFLWSYVKCFGLDIKKNQPYGWLEGLEVEIFLNLYSNNEVMITDIAYC